MLETRFKVAMLLAVLVLTSLPVMGILRGTTPPPEDPLPSAKEMVMMPSKSNEGTRNGQSFSGNDESNMMLVPAGPFIRGTALGGYDESPERVITLDAYAIDRYEITNQQYQSFVASTGHRKAAPPSRYAKNLARMQGPDQPVVYVSWDDAKEYCAWAGKRLPTEAEWEKAMRGTDGRLWPWGNQANGLAANLGLPDGHEVTAPVGTFTRDISPFGVADGTGNVMEWVADWYEENAYRDAADQNPTGPEFGVFRVLRGGGYTNHGTDVRITSRSKMVPDFRDETIGFRCAKSVDERRGRGETGSVKKS